MTSTSAVDSTTSTTEKTVYKPPVRFDETVEDLFDDLASSQNKLETGLQDSGMTAAFRSPDATAINEVMSVAINSFADELSTMLEEAELEEIPEAFAEVIGLIEAGMTEAASHKDFIDMVGVLQGGMLQLKEESDKTDITNEMFKTALENTMEDIRMQVRKSFGVDSEEYEAMKIFQEGVGKEMYKGLLSNLTVQVFPISFQTPLPFKTGGIHGNACHWLAEECRSAGRLCLYQASPLPHIVRPDRAFHGPGKMNPAHTR